MRRKLVAHLWTLPRWFALPFFGSSAALGAILAGGSVDNLHLWMAVVATSLLMAGGHSFNSFLDYFWTGLDKGEAELRSAEKLYCGGQNLLEKRVVRGREVLANACGWYLLALVPLLVLSFGTSFWVLGAGIGGMLITFWYSKAKFNYTHEICLGIGCGPIPVLIGLYAMNSSPPLATGLLASVPIAIILSFAGLAVDEYPDVEANLKKGVKSLAYEVKGSSISLCGYILGWVVLLYTYQVFLISVGRLPPWTGLTFSLVPPLMGTLVFLGKVEREVEGIYLAPPPDHNYFSKVATILVAIAALYPILLTLGVYLDLH